MFCFNFFIFYIINQFVIYIKVSVSKGYPVRSFKPIPLDLKMDPFILKIMTGRMNAPEGETAVNLKANIPE